MANEEATAVNEAAEQTTATTESAPVENNSSDKAKAVELNDSGEYTSEDLKTGSDDDSKSDQTDDTADNSEDDSSAEETKSEDEKPKSGAEKRKQQLEGDIEQLKKENGIDPSTEIRDLVAARNALRELNEAKQREAQIATEQELLGQVNPETGQPYTVQEAERISRAYALEKAQETASWERYQLEVRNNQVALGSEAQKAIEEFPMFDPQSDQYNPEVAAQVDGILEQSLIYEMDEQGNVVVDQQGQPVVIGSHISPYQLYKTYHDATSVNSTADQIKGQKAVEKMIASADSAPNAPSAEKSFNKMSVTEKQEYLRKKGHDI